MASLRTFLLPKNRLYLRSHVVYMWNRTTTLYRRNTSYSSSVAEQTNGGVLTLSDNCVKQLVQVAETPDTMLRVTVEGGGCSGFQYRFDLDTKRNKDDRVFERDGAKVVIDELSLGFLSGSTIDYHKELIRSSFHVINNPNAEQGCSCGVSFALK